jgi:hypothetical protein
MIISPCASRWYREISYLRSSSIQNTAAKVNFAPVDHVRRWPCPTPRNPCLSFSLICRRRRKLVQLSVTILVQIDCLPCSFIFASSMHHFGRTWQHACVHRSDTHRTRLIFLFIFSAVWTLGGICYRYCVPCNSEESNGPSPVPICISNLKKLDDFNSVFKLKNKLLYVIHAYLEIRIITKFD